MELTARIKERQNKDTRKRQFNKITYFMETPCRRYVPFFQHLYRYTKRVEIKTGRKNKRKPDKHIIYALFICQWLFNYWDDDAPKKKDKEDGVKNSDLYLTRGLAFDKTLPFYKRREKVYGLELDDEEGRKPPKAYDDFFDESLQEDEKERKRHLNNNAKMDDYYNQVNYEDYCKIIGELLKTYEKYLSDTDGFKKNIKENKIADEDFSRRYDFTINNVTGIVKEVIGKSPNGKEVFYKFNKYHLYEGWTMCCNRFKKKLEKTFPYKKDTKKKKFTWKMIRSKKKKQHIRINKSR